MQADMPPQDHVCVGIAGDDPGTRTPPLNRTPRRRSWAQWMLGGLLIGWLSGCAAFVENFRPVLYGKTAKDNYERGMRSMKGESFLDSEKYFHYILDTYPVTRYRTWAELGVADSAYGREAYVEAIDLYKQFASSHPDHPKTKDGYCAYRVGESYYKQIPGDWFLVPPSFEKDQGPVLDAARELCDFLDHHGDSPFASNARRLFGEVVQRLADHELYVARFYLDRDKPQAAIWRLEYVVTEYPGARREAEVLLLLGQVYLKQSKPRDARDTFRRITLQYPNGSLAKQAQVYLDYIEERYKELPPPSLKPDFDVGRQRTFCPNILGKSRNVPTSTDPKEPSEQTPVE
jgi:outer membrane protein assembly factor BamD